MFMRAAFLFVVLLCSTQILDTAEPEVLPTPAQSVMGPVQAPRVTAYPVPASHYNSDTGRRLSARLEVASAVVRRRFRDHAGRTHPATWFADSVRRKADQLEQGFSDGAPRKLLLRNMLEIHADVDELMQQVALCQLGHVQRHVPKYLHQIECSRRDLGALLGLELAAR